MTDKQEQEESAEMKGIRQRYEAYAKAKVEYYKDMIKLIQEKKGVDMGAVAARTFRVPQLLDQDIMIMEKIIVDGKIGDVEILYGKYKPAIDEWMVFEKEQKMKQDAIAIVNTYGEDWDTFMDIVEQTLDEYDAAMDKQDEGVDKE